MLFVSSSFFFFNDTATTDIYTWTHSFPTRRSSDLWKRCGNLFPPLRVGREGQVRLPLLPMATRSYLGCLAQELGLKRGAELGTTATVEGRSEEHTSELQSLMRISYAVFCLKKKNI